MTPSSDPGRLAIFTICSNNYLPMARAFFASARQHHPEASLFLCLADTVAAPLSRYDGTGEIVTLDRLDIDNLPEFTFRYDVMELNTAAKPFMFNYLFDRRGFDQVVYFDPDIILYAPLSGVLADLHAGASMVLTPHITRPSEQAGAPRDRIFMLAGTYNLGFMAAARRAETADLLHWWARALRYDCINEQAAGLFVDQKFMDMAPAFAPNLRVNPDPALNVAYWNIAQRQLDEDPYGWTIDGKPLVFFHFSGLDPKRPSRLSRHAPADADPPGKPLARLIADYIDRLREHGLGTEPAPPYAFGHFASGVPIPRCVRHMFRADHPAYPDDPFTTYEATLHLPAPEAVHTGTPYVVTNLLRYLHSQSPWLAAHHTLANPHHARILVTWFVRHAAREFGLDPRLVAPVAERIGMAPSARALPIPTRGDADVTVIGYLRATSGVGQAGRMTLAALATSPGLRCEGIDIAHNVVADRSQSAVDGHLVEHGTGRLQIFHINADQLPLVVEATRARLPQQAYRAAVPFWELETLPEAWHGAFDAMDEVWAPSRFMQTILIRSIDKPVLYMPPALPPLTKLPGGRESFGLPRQNFLFFYAFDFLSYPARKNPLGAIAAFALAFPREDGAPAGLVIKTLNAALGPEAFARLQDAVAGDPRIIVLDRALSRDDMTRLICGCDAVLSLHRSEGFGLLVAEAMLLGKPVIATDYGATTEMLTPETGYPVQYGRIPVRDGEYPFAAGQIWADPDIDHAAWLMQQMLAHPEASAGKCAAAWARITRNYGIAAVAARQQARLRALDRIAA